MTSFDLRAPNSPSGREILLYLLRGRAAYRVFQAMSDAYNTEAEVDELANDDNLKDALDNAAVIIADIRRELTVLGPELNLELYLATVEDRYPHLLETVGAVADELGVNPHDLISVLLNA